VQARVADLVSVRNRGLTPPAVESLLAPGLGIVQVGSRAASLAAWISVFFIRGRSAVAACSRLTHRG